MRAVGNRRILAHAQVRMRREIIAEFKKIADTVRGIILRVANPDRIDIASERTLIRQIGVVIQRLFVGMDGRSPYAPDGETALAVFPHIPPYHPHDMCHVRPVMVDNPRAVSDRLRAVMDDARAEVLRPVTTPAQPGRLLLELVGQTLLRVAGQELGIRVGQLPLSFT